jgi:hypothetical protein
MPTRDIPASRAFNTRGIIASSKAVGKAMYESALERDHLLLLDFDRTVKRFEVQPIKIDMSHVPGHRHYTPDVLIEFELGYGQPCLSEVKFEEDLRRNYPDLKPKFKAAMHVCRMRGWIFHIVTERHVRTPLLENVRFLRDYRLYPVDAELSSRIAKAASAPCHIEALRNAITNADPQQVLAAIWHHLWHGRLVANLDNEQLHMRSEVRWHAVF